MRAVVQRVSSASVTVNSQVVGAIGRGLLVLLAISDTDKQDSIYKLADKIINLRIFSDTAGKMNLSVKDCNGAILVVSQFTLYGDTKKGNRPSFITAARPEKAILFYDEFVNYIRGQAVPIADGQFGAEMAVALVNDGPVTLIIDI